MGPSSARYAKKRIRLVRIVIKRLSLRGKRITSWWRSCFRITLRVMTAPYLNRLSQSPWTNTIRIWSTKTLRGSWMIDLLRTGRCSKSPLNIKSLLRPRNPLVVVLIHRVAGSWLLERKENLKVWISWSLVIIIVSSVQKLDFATIVTFLFDSPQKLSDHFKYACP